MKLEELKQLSIKQVLAIIGFWNSAPDELTNKQFKNFTEFVGAIQKGYPYNENQNMVINLKSDEPGVMSVTRTFPHAFADMYEAEEALLFNILKEKFEGAEVKELSIW